MIRLALCKYIVSQSGGDCGVHSSIGEGSSFWFQIPWRLQEHLSSENSNQEQPVASPMSSKSSFNILVVDDDKITRMLMARLLEGLGHKVSLAVDGLDAISKVLGDSYESESEVKSHQGFSLTSSSSTLNYPFQNSYPSQSFDVILMDNQMPNLSGLDATKRLRNCGVNVPIIGITGNALVRAFG